ncbi:MAG: hypothetical protein ACJAVV_000682 [Alphaproteobacteria bacterium]|jgi:hypothetical protein
MLYQSLLIQAVFNQSKDSPELALSDSVQTITSSTEGSTEQTKQHSAFGLYHNNYIENGIRAMSITYRSVFAIMDEDDFRKLSIGYLSMYPKTCFDWADYGEGFSDYMLNIDALASMPFLPELADIDWRLMHIERTSNQSFDGASFGLLQTIPLDNLYFECAPGLQVTEAIFPIQELYQLAHQFVDEKQIGAEQAQKTSHVNKINNLINIAIKSPSYRSIVLWREEYKGLFEYCDTASANAFSSMLANNSISDVLSHFGDDQSAMTNWLQLHIQSRKIFAVVEKD